MTSDDNNFNYFPEIQLTKFKLPSHNFLIFAPCTPEDFCDAFCVAVGAFGRPCVTWRLHRPWRRYPCSKNRVTLLSASPLYGRFVIYVDTLPTRLLPFSRGWCIPDSSALDGLRQLHRLLVGILAYLQRRLQSVLNAAAHLVFRLRRYDHVTDALAIGYISWLRVPPDGSTSNWHSWHIEYCTVWRQRT